MKKNNGARNLASTGAKKGTQQNRTEQNRTGVFAGCAILVRSSCMRKKVRSGTGRGYRGRLAIDSMSPASVCLLNARDRGKCPARYQPSIMHNIT
jgi:hypothetical protein